MHALAVLLLSFCLLVGIAFNCSASEFTDQIIDKKIEVQEIDKASFTYGACVQAYVCEKLHSLSKLNESLYDVELRLGKETVGEFSEEAKLSCLK